MEADPQEAPTAMHAVALVQETPLRVPLGRGFGVASTFQLPPVQDSAREGVPVAESRSPTAWQALVETQDTAEKSPFGLSFETNVQWSPFQYSATVSSAAVRIELPTAMHT